MSGYCNKKKPYSSATVTVDLSWNRCVYTIYVSVCCTLSGVLHNIIIII